ncbi:MAG: ribonuclease protein component [Bacteroidota bacterium]|jgi:ribonuclease P protein component
MNAFPIKLIYTIQTASDLAADLDTAYLNKAILFSKGILQTGVGAPSRTFRKAVMRNRVKRLLREGYRLERPAFVSHAALAGKRVNLFFLYTDATVLSQPAIQEKIKQLLQRLSEKLSNIPSEQTNEKN